MAVLKAGTAKGWNKSQQTDRMDQPFLQGLNKKVRLKLSRLRIKGTEPIIEYISEIVTQILNEAALEPSTECKSTSFILEQSKEVKTKWCKMHRNGTHSTEECLSTQKDSKAREVEKKSSSMNKNSSSYYYLKENCPGYKRIELSDTINEVPVLFVLGTEAYANSIDSNIAERCKLEKSDVKREKNITLGDGSHTKKIGTINCDFEINTLEKTKIKEEFILLPNLASSNIILGMPFLQRQRVILDFSHHLIRINERFIRIEDNEDNDAALDELIGRLRVLNENSNDINYKLENMLVGYKLSNPELGCITVLPHRIKLKDNRSITSKPYPIPLALEEPVKLEVQRLLKEGIIRSSESEYSSPV